MLLNVVYICLYCIMLLMMDVMCSVTVDILAINRSMVSNIETIV